MKVLVTGAAGFIGSHTSEKLLALGHEVIGVDNFNDYYNIDLKRLNAKQLVDKGVTMLKEDLKVGKLSEKLPTDVEYIFHCAAQPGISVSTSYEEYLGNNITATKNLIDYAEQCPSLKLLVNIGTSSIYGLEATFPENVAPQPASYYGVTKLAAEQLVLQKSREKIFPSCSLRLFSVIGPRERPEKMYTKLIEKGLNDEPFPLYSGSEKHIRSFTYVGDIVEGLTSVIGKEKQVDGEIFNIGTEKEHTTQEGIEAVEKVLGKKIKIEIVQKRPGDQLRTAANIDKARRVLDFDPRTSLLEAVQSQVKWYKDNIYNPNK